MTPLRTSQVKHTLEGLVRLWSPHMQTDDGLRQAVRELADDRHLWSELELQRNPLPEPTQRATMLSSPLMEAGHD